MKVFIIDFSGGTGLTELIAKKKQYEVHTELADGGKAYATAGDLLPDRILINYRDKPSHGRQTAIAIHTRKRTAAIPIYFVDGSSADNDLVRSIGTCIRGSDLEQHF